jgi:ATP-dependent DNA helicase RecQ
LRGLKSEFGNVPVLALTATATRVVAADIIQQLGMVQPDGYKGSFFRPNLRIACQKKGGGRNTRRDILGLIRVHAGESGIVYCLSRKAVEQTTEFLRSQGVRALPYHAGLSDDERRRNQDAFSRDDVDVVVATVAFGMGIDKSNVRFVIHRDMPKTLENYSQEIGRAGRDGLPSDCVLFYSWADVMAYDGFRTDAPPEHAAQLKRKTVEMFRWADRRACRHRGLSAVFEEDIDVCGESCDVCRGVSVDDFLGEDTPAAGVGAQTGRPQERRPFFRGGSRAVPTAQGPPPFLGGRPKPAGLSGVQRRGAPWHGGTPPANPRPTFGSLRRGPDQADPLRAGVFKGN